MKRLALLALVVGAATIGGAVVVAVTLENGFSVRDEPTYVDALVARWWRRLAVPQEEKGARNPLPAGAEVLARGREHFAADCASCHGSNGRGDTPLGRALYPPPPDLASAATQSLPDGEIFWVIQNGVRLSGMPARDGEGAEHERQTWELVHFVRALPSLSAKDVEATQAMEPRSPREVATDAAARRFLGEPGMPSPAPEDAHHEASFMGSVADVDFVRLQVRTADAGSVSFLLDHGGSTRFTRASRPITVGEVQVGDRVVVRAARDRDWWLAREVRLSRKKP